MATIRDYMQGYIELPTAATKVLRGKSSGDSSDAWSLTSGGTFTTAGTVLAAALGVGNSASAATLGTVTKKLEVFDAAGASLGFVPIYGGIA